MKWTDRFGNHCEGTVEEYRESLGIQEEPVKNKKDVLVDVGRRYSRFSKLEKKIIKDNPDKNASELQTLLPNRSRKSLWLWRKQLLKKGTIVPNKFRSHFSKLEKKIIKDNPDMSVKELRRLLPNRSKPTIYKYRKKLLAKKYWHNHKKNASKSVRNVVNKSIRWTKVLDDTIVQLRNDGKSIKQVRKVLADVVGHKVSGAVVSSRLNILGKSGIKVALDDKSQDRGRMGQFIKSRSRYLMNNFHYDYEKSKGMARDEWRVKQHSIPNVKIQQPKKVFRLMKLDFDDQSVKTVDVFSSRDDALAKLNELIIADQSISTHTEYYITDAENQKV